MDRAIKKVIAYDNLLRNTEDLTKLEGRYRITLLDRSWPRCQCPICQELGIEVVIFRGLNRNKRRGFHNIYSFNVLGRSKHSVTELAAAPKEGIEEEGA